VKCVFDRYRRTTREKCLNLYALNNWRIDVETNGRVEFPVRHKLMERLQGTAAARLNLNGYQSGATLQDIIHFCVSALTFAEPIEKLRVIGELLAFRREAPSNFLSLSCE